MWKDGHLTRRYVDPADSALKGLITPHADNAHCHECDNSFTCKGVNTSSLSEHRARAHHIQVSRARSSSLISPSTSGNVC